MWVWDSESVLDFGRQEGLLLQDGVGIRELAGILDPVPVAAGQAFPSNSLPGDPFSDAGRPLVMTIASDCAGLSASWRSQLLSLCRYPGVELVLSPGVDALGYRQPRTLAWEIDGTVMRARAARSAAAELDREFERFDGPATGVRQRPRTAGTGYLVPVDIELGRRMLRRPPEVADRLLQEASAHAALGCDYFVSPAFAGASRRWPRRGWLGEFGACTPREAIAMAGLKSRMYRAAPIMADPHMSHSLGLGLWLDHAVMDFTPGLYRALRGALAPGVRAPRMDDEWPASPYLLAVRRRLQELLLARDSIHRLWRRQALGTRWVRRFDTGVAPGVFGNDLTALLAYHLTSALDAMYSATDNLAWVAASRDGVPPDNGRVGLWGLVADDRGRRHAWRDGPRCEAASSALLGSRHLGGLLALRDVRNRSVHREGLARGAVLWEPPSAAPVDAPPVVWVMDERADPQRLSDGTELRVHPLLAPFASLRTDDLLVFTFSDLADLLWEVTSGIVSDVLTALPWPTASRRWRRTTEGPRPTDRTWRRREQRRLWGL